jgi:acetyl esterase/lipase
MSKAKGKQKRTNSIGAIGQGIRRRTSGAKKWGGYPVVINFHGGGFTLGTATDDSRWCSTVVNECNAVVVSVDYRLAPENPFPTAVEDGVDAVIWIHKHAAELGIDKDKIALSGFSAGGNMAFTVPLRLWDEMMGFPRDEDNIRPNSPPNPFTSGESSPASSTTAGPSQVEVLDPIQPPQPIHTTTDKSGVQASHGELKRISDISLRAIVPWYPSLNYNQTRAQKRATTVRKDQDLPAFFTDLFDESYLHPPDTISLDSPYLSPGIAPTSLLKNALPQEIIMHTCEWDMLLDEGQVFRDRLMSEEIGKKVNYTMIKGVPHGWDKAPNPLKPTPGVKEHYLAACKELRRIFGETGLKERRTEEGGWSAAPRGSVSVVR